MGSSVGGLGSGGRLVSSAGGLRSNVGFLGSGGGLFGRSVGLEGVDGWPMGSNAEPGDWCVVLECCWRGPWEPFLPGSWGRGGGREGS